jgi:hypothetical protein
MERMTHSARPRGMKGYCRIRGLAAAGLLSAALAGCGTAVQSASPATTRPAPGTGGVAQAAVTSEVGCDAANQATSVTIERLARGAEGVNSGVRNVTQRNAKLVRALFHDFCAALATAGTPRPGFACIAGLGSTYTGTFYDGQRTLATFSYSLSGCPQIRLTASGKTRATFVLGKAAAAAPHLKGDLAAVLGSRGPQP